MRAFGAGCAVGAAALALVACASDESAGTTTSVDAMTATVPATAVSSTGSAPAEASTDATAGGDSDGGDVYRSPLEVLLGFGAAVSTAEDTAQKEGQQRQVEEQIAECMQAQGFDYVAYVPDYAAIDAADPRVNLSAADFAAQYGYGISTIDDSAQQSADPNEQIRADMDITQLRAYYKALYGDLITIDDDGNLVKRGPAPAAVDGPASDGCSIEASNAVYGDKTEQPTESDDPFVALEQSLDALSQSIEEDSRVVDATNTWIGCMADAGHPGYHERTDAPVDVGDRANQLLDGATDYSDVDPAALQELRAYEIGVAVADYDCGLAWDAVHQSVQTERENAFIDENREELERYADALSDGTAGHG